MMASYLGFLFFLLLRYHCKIKKPLAPGEVSGLLL